MRARADVGVRRYLRVYPQKQAFDKCAREYVLGKQYILEFDTSGARELRRADRETKEESTRVTAELAHALQINSVLLVQTRWSANKTQVNSRRRSPKIIKLGTPWDGVTEPRLQSVCLSLCFVGQGISCGIARSVFSSQKNEQLNLKCHGYMFEVGRTTFTGATIVTWLLFRVESLY